MHTLCNQMNKKRSTEWGALVDTFKGNKSSENKDKGQQESEDEDGVEEGSIGNVASCDLDLHQVNKPIFARYRDASHARREVKLHRRLCCCRTTTGSLPPTTTLQPPETIFITHVPTIIRSTIFLLQGGSPPPTTPHWSFQPIGYRSLAQRFQLSSGFWSSSSMDQQQQRREREKQRHTQHRERNYVFYFRKIMKNMKTFCLLVKTVLG